LVASRDSDDVYYFFDVIASAAPSIATAQANVQAEAANAGLNIDETDPEHNDDDNDD
jgi:hypothetical protein